MKKILLLALGSRGDVEPFLAVGQILKKEGYEVACAAPAQYEDLVIDSNLVFFPFSEKFLQLLELEETKNHMGQKGSRIKRSIDLIKIFSKSSSIQKLLVKEQSDYVEKFKPDFVFHHMKCMYAIIWGIANPNKVILLSPVPGVLHKIIDFSPLVPKKEVKPWILNIVYKFLPIIYSFSVIKYTKDNQKDFPHIKFSLKLVTNYLLNKEKAIYTISPSLFPKPKSWGNHISVVGYFEREKTKNWIPNEELNQFISKNDNILFITFGSMVNEKPEIHTQTIIDLVSKHKIPTIINTSAGGLLKIKNVPNNIIFTETIPYEWIFLKVYAVIHHGGSGTTHTVLKHGKPNLIIPHILDQFYWNHLNAKLGAGPTGIPIKKLSKESIEPLVLDLMKNDNYKLAAQRISDKMSKENNEQLKEILSMD